MSAQANFLAECFADGVYAGAWFETVEAASNWLRGQKYTWHKITPRATVMAEAAKQDEILRSM